MDTSRLLIGLGADLSLRDGIHGNTPLHWACNAKNYPVILLLLRAGASITDLNRNRESPLDVIKKTEGPNAKHGPPSKIITDLGGGAGTGSPFSKLRQSKRFRTMVMSVMPAISLLLIGLILQSDHRYLTKGLFFFLLYVFMNSLGKAFFDDRLMKILPLGVYIGTKIVFYCVWFAFTMEFAGQTVTLWYVFLSLFMWYFFFKTWLNDPGTIKSSKEEKYRTLIEMAERDGEYDDRVNN